MWIASSLGFFSIVKKSDIYHIRARFRNDLVNLTKAAGIKAGAEVGLEMTEKLQARIERWDGADYRFRIQIVTPQIMEHIFSALLWSITYPNFKEHISDRPCQIEKMDAYYMLWGNLRDLQDVEE